MNNFDYSETDMFMPHILSKGRVSAALNIAANYGYRKSMTTTQSLKDENARAMAVIDGLVRDIGGIRQLLLQLRGQEIPEVMFLMRAGHIVDTALATAKAFKEVK